MTQYIKKLPAVFQTVTEKKFFDATFDQIFSKKDSDLLYGYIGRRIPGKYNPVSDFYLPEPSKDRTWWQLEATAFSRNDDSTKSNVFFYDDLLNRINYYGGNTLNQDRLFESEYYSWAPPIDFDMFTNYQSYYWVEQGLVSINITGVSYSDIVGQPSFTTPSTATPANLTLTTGMNILLVDDPLYPNPLTVENIGNCVGIRLVDEYPDYTSGTILEYLPWDGTIQLANNKLIRNTNWDTLTWDVQPQPGNADYITIERGSLDRNAWSRTNKWFHIDAINASVRTTHTPFPSNATRALRPIIQFTADLTLFNSGTQFKDTITYGFVNDFFGNPLLLSQFQGQTEFYIDSQLDVQLREADLVVFMNDELTNTGIYQVSISGNIVTFVPYASIINGDILFITSDAPFDGASRGQTWFYNIDVWQEVANDKVSNNQPPLFQLYDHNNVPLNDLTTYPLSTFTGNKIFSYKINTTAGAAVDPVLKFPIVYTSLGQSSDILFQNNLITDRYTYGSVLPIDGYYYYNTSDSSVLYNSWNLYTPCACSNIVPILPPDCIALSKQRVIDKFVVGYGTEYQFRLSVTPYGFPASPDIVVSVNGEEIKSVADQANGYVISVINNSIYVDLETYLSALLSVNQSQPPVVEIDTYTHGLLDPTAPGYFEIPQQLDANPSQLEVSEISASNLIQQFSSIIENQSGFVGTAFGGNNNYRDSGKNRSVGLFILQNVAPALKSMLVSSSTDLDIISGIRFSEDEYTKFKNKFVRTAARLIDQEFSPVQYHNNTIVVSAWVEEILKTVNISKEFSNAFAYSFMIANGSPYTTESITVPAGGFVTLADYINLTDPRNSLYIYDVTGQEQLLTIGIDYEIVSTNLTIDIQFNSALAGNNVYVALYKNPLPAYIPSTPTKIGVYNAFVPRIELDTSYAVPTNVIIGHDGSKTIAYGDYRDQLLLELEKRIYNLLQYRFRNQYYLPLRLEDIKSGYFRKTRYSRAEYLEITESYINKWSAKNKANYRVNDWLAASANLPLNSPELWKLYNYASAVTPSGTKLNLPGNWKGIFQYYYDTYYPDTRPWEMLGFSSQPTWWVAQYGTSWNSTNTALWSDLEDGMIRQGPSAIFDPVTLLPQVQSMWARPGLSAIIPVDALGQIIPVPTLFNVAVSGNLYEPFDGFDNTWKYGDGAPVEQAWMSTSGYAFNVQEFLYLMKPGPFGELLWDTTGTELSPGKLNISGVDGPVMSSTNWQYVQNDTFTNPDPFFAWMRPKNKDQFVHAENIDSTVQIRFGYQRWISDRILFLGKDISTTFGRKVRTLDVNLANKLAGFTNKDTTTTYIESVSTSATTTSLLIPTNNFEVILHKGQPIKTYAYSGVVIRSLENGMFVVYGYDLLNSEFIVLNRSNSQMIDITVGGTPAEFKPYTAGDTYQAGDIVRYNGVYYMSLALQVAGKFNATNWQKLKSLPTVDGISVVYKPVSETSSVRVPYGTVLETVQDVFDLLIGWGAYLETQGWQFTEVNQSTNQLNDWLGSAKQFLFWINTNWAPDASIQLSPSANNAVLIVQGGYPNDVESMTNGVYSILDKYGVAIPPNSTTTDRDGLSIAVSPVDLATGGIFFLQVNASETEHVLIFDNTTSFSDVIYDPLLRARQQRLRYNGFRSNGWYGKMEAPGYLIIDNQLVPNYDTIVEAMRYYYDPNITIDNPSLEDLGRHLIGYESKSYLDNLQVSNDVQYLFYQGAIRQKGTTQAFDKLFRSTKVQSNETIEVYEEWALKLAEFGNTVEQVSTEFILKPEQNTGEVIVARLNFVPSTVGFVKEINILNAENRYTKIPKIVISAPDAVVIGFDNTAWSVSAWDPATTTRQATAYAVLDAAGIISRIDMIDQGAGYLTAPLVTIDSGNELHQLDKLYAVWQGEIIRDDAKDNIIEIDVDDTSVWTVRPPDPQYSLEFPTTNVIEYSMPNAGYVNFNDVTWTSFNVLQTATGWGTAWLNPAVDETIWVAKTFTEDWDVYKLTEFPSSWKVVEDAAGNLLLLTDTDVTVVPQLSEQVANRTDFGNMVCLQIVENNTVDPTTNYTVGFADAGLYTDPVSLDVYNSYSLLTLDGVPVTSTDIAVYDEFTNLLLFKTMRFSVLPISQEFPLYVEFADKIWVDDIDSKWNVLTVTSTVGFDVSLYDAATIAQPLYWNYPYAWDVNGPAVLIPYRTQESLIDTKLFESSQVFQTRTQTELILLPVYDPFKTILPALAKQNITYMLLQDPAKYNVSGNIRLFSENVTFGESQVGKLWWDLSEIRYAYYEQPIALNGSETSTDNLIYRRDHWGQVFPGSTFNIYEWTKSPVPPAQYTGTGIPRSTTDYVQLTTSNRFTNISETNYYFWVLNPTDKPNIENRTLAGSEVARLLAFPKSQGFTFFAPIQQTATNNSYMFYNIQEILAYKGDNIQIKYRLAVRDDQKHTQWKFFREGDSGSLVTDQFWNKMVDSLCAYTEVLPSSDEWTTGIQVADNLPWNLFQWNITPWNDATTNTTATYGEILPVPDPSLSESEKYGIEYRPRQGMFVDLFSARKIFVEAGNNLLKHIPIRDNNPGWNLDVSTDAYWDYTTWYEIGFENVTPIIVFSTLALAHIALTAGQLPNGAIVEITNGTADNRFTLYNVIQLNPLIATQSFQLVGIEASAVNLLDTIYTVKGIYSLSVELRELLTAFRTQVFINNYLVDQNELYFSMLNFVVSEQKNPNWLFKTSYIYIKENNIPLAQQSLYVPDQISNIIDYINDSKPYHTQIRDYTSTHLAADIATGAAVDSMKSKATLTFGPFGTTAEYWDGSQWDTMQWDPVDSIYARNLLDAQTFVDNITTLVESDAAFVTPLTFYDVSKVGYSQLFPYTFNSQLFITPSNIVAVRIGAAYLYYGNDYYVEYNNNSTYTVYFYNDPGTSPIPEAIVVWDGGPLSTLQFNSYRNELAIGYASDNFVVNVDTKLPVINVQGMPELAPATVAPYTGWGDIWNSVGSEVAQILGTSNVPWNIITDVSQYESLTEFLPNTVSFKQNLNLYNKSSFYRNSDRYEGALVNNLPAPTSVTENLYVITVFVDPLTHPITTNILPNVGAGLPVGVIWVNGERIEYREKTLVSADTWELRVIQRGTLGTAPTSHDINSAVWVEKNNIFVYMPANTDVWNSATYPATPDGSSEIPGHPLEYTSINNAPLGGIWYAGTPESAFLRQGPGSAIP